MAEEKQEILQLNLDDIIPNRFQPREVFDEKALKELAASIKEHGVIQPIIVRNVNGKYEIIAGERRYKASALAGKTTIPAIVKNLDDKESSKVALLENLQRKNLNPIEEAKTYQKILELDEMTQEELAKTMGKSQSAVSNKMRLLQLTEEVQQAVLKEEISERHARTLLRVTDSKKQIEMLKKVIAEKINVRDLEKMIDEIYPKEKKEEKQEDVSVSNNFLNTTPLETTVEISKPDEGYGEIKILPPEGEEETTAPKFLNYGEIKDEDDEEDENEEQNNNFFNSIEPIDINNIKQNTQDISSNESSNSTSLDSLLNLQLETFSELGSGFNLSMQDLDIRGAGNLLGAEQSGFMEDLGFETYQKILSQAMTELKNERELESGLNQSLTSGLTPNPSPRGEGSGYPRGRTASGHITPPSPRRGVGGEAGGETPWVADCSVESDLEMYFPELYVPSSAERMLLYRELDSIKNDRDLETFKNRLRDRFGKIPIEGEELLNVVPLRRLGMRLGCEKIILKQGQMTLHFVSNADSPYYQSEAFGAIINYASHNVRRCALRENRGKRMMVVKDIPSVQQALYILQDIETA